MTPREQEIADAPDLDYPITPEEAEQFEIKINVGNFKLWKTLLWIANHRPLILESYIDEEEPGTLEFWAVCLVYYKYEHLIRAAVDRRNQRIQRACNDGIAAAGPRRIILSADTLSRLDNEPPDRIRLTEEVLRVRIEELVERVRIIEDLPRVRLSEEVPRVRIISGEQREDYQQHI